MSYFARNDYSKVMQCQVGVKPACGSKFESRSSRKLQWPRLY